MGHVLPNTMPEEESLSPGIVYFWTHSIKHEKQGEISNTNVRLFTSVTTTHVVKTDFGLGCLSELGTENKAAVLEIKGTRHF